MPEKTLYRAGEMYTCKKPDPCENRDDCLKGISPETIPSNCPFRVHFASQLASWQEGSLLNSSPIDESNLSQQNLPVWDGNLFKDGVVERF